MVSKMPSELSSEPAAERMNPATIFTGHLHPLTLVFGIWHGLRNAWPLLLAAFFGNRWIAFVLLPLSLGGTVAFAALRYFSFSYRIENGELITKHGWLSRSERHIPLARVQEIRLEQHLLHRVFGVVDAQIETASGKGAEATLSVLSRAEAERLRQAVFSRGAQVETTQVAATQPEAVPEAVLVRRLTLRELALAGLTSNHLVSALVIAGAIWQFAQDALPQALRARLRSFATQTLTGFVLHGGAFSLWFWVAASAALLLVSMLFSMAGSIVLFFDFTLTRQGDDLQRRYGLLTRRSSNLPRHRIQVLKIEESFLRRWFGFATISADVSGNQRKSNSDRQGRDVLIPLLRRDEYEKLLPIFLPDLAAPRTVWRPVSPRAIRRGTMKSARLLILLTAMFFFWQRNWLAIWPLLLIPVAYFFHRESYRHLGYAMTQRYLFTREGWLGRATRIIPISKIQGLEITQTPFDRRMGLAGLNIDTAGQAFTGGVPRIKNLPLTEAEELARTLAQQAGLTPYRG